MKKLTELRLANNMSQIGLAKKIGVTDSAICQYESGKRTPNIKILKKIATVFNCSVDELLE